MEDWLDLLRIDDFDNDSGDLEDLEAEEVHALVMQ